MTGRAPARSRLSTVLLAIALCAPIAGAGVSACGDDDEPGVQVEPLGGAPAGYPTVGRGPAAPSRAVPTPAGFRLVTGPGGRWAFAIPDRWQEGPRPLATTVAVYRDLVPLGNFRTNVNLNEEPYDGDGPTYAAANAAVLQRSARVLRQRAITIGGLGGLEVEATWAGTPPYRTLQRLTANRGKGFVLTCTGADATFETVRGDCDRILATLRLP